VLAMAAAQNESLTDATSPAAPASTGR
jgi:hypothetical protein